MQQNITVHYKKSNTEKISGAQDCSQIFSVSFLGSAVISSGNLNQKNPHFSWSRWSSALLMLVSWQMLHIYCDPAHSRGFETRWLWSFSFQAILYAAYHNGYCLPDLRQIQLTVMTIISKGIYHTVHFYHVYLALYTDNLFINCSRLLLFTLIIPIILDFFFDCKEVLTCFHSSFSHCKIWLLLGTANSVTGELNCFFPAISLDNYLSFTCCFWGATLFAMTL